MFLHANPFQFPKPDFFATRVPPAPFIGPVSGLSFIPSDRVVEDASGEDPLLTVQSSDVVNLPAFRTDPRFAGIDGSGFSVVIIDTGIDVNHPFFGPDADSNGVADRIVFQQDFFGANDPDASDTNGHGSNVASIALSSDSTYRGMAPGADIIALKVFADGSTTALNSVVEEALQWVVTNGAAYNVASVNLSIGSGNHGLPVTTDVRSDEFASLVTANMIPVAAAGNSFALFGGGHGVAYPAADPNVLAVGSVYDANVGPKSYSAAVGSPVANTTAADRIAPYSQRHSTMLDVFAPGSVISGANHTGGVSNYEGTSQASPHVAGLAALAQQLADQVADRRLTFAEFNSLMKSTGVTINDGDDEDDNVTNTNLNFKRVDMLALGDAILGLDPDDQISEAIDSTVGVTQAGDVTALTDADLFKFTVSAGQRIGFDLDRTGVSTLDSVLRLFDVSGNELAVSNDANPPGEAGGSGESYIDYTFTTAGTYYVGVSGAGNSGYNAAAGTGDAAATSIGAYELVTTGIVGPPVVTNVFVNGSAWTNNYRNALAASAEGESAFGYRVKVGEQTRTLAWSNLNRISIRFSEPVNVSSNDLTVTGVNATYGFSPVAGVIYDAATNTATWLLNRAIINDKITLTLDSAPGTGITDASGNALDGEWTNPTFPSLSADTLPSGDGTAGGNFNFDLRILPGDVTHDGNVNAFDANTLRENLGIVGAGVSGGDINGDNLVSVVDANAQRAYLGKSSPI